jgi:uncharacterized membrane protein
MPPIIDAAAAEVPPAAVPAPRIARSHTRARWVSRDRLDLVLIAIIVFAAVLRIWGLGAQSIWYDEWLTTQAIRSFRGIFDHVREREGITATFFVGMYAWAKVFGTSEAALRAVSALAGIATVPVVYAAVRAFGLRRATARVAALLIAVNPMLVWYSQEARPYSALALLGALSVWLFARVRTHGAMRDVALWGGTCALAFALHYQAIFLILAEVAALLVIRRDRWVASLVACVPTALVGLLLAPVALEQRTHEANYEWISNWRVMVRVREAGRSALVGPMPFHSDLWIGVAFAAALAAVLLILSRDRDAQFVAGLLTAIGAAAVAMPLAAMLVGVDLFLGRYLIAVLIPLTIAVAIGLTSPPMVWLGRVGVVLICVASLAAIIGVARDSDLRKPDWEKVARTHEVSNPNSVLLMRVHGYLGQPLLYYSAGSRALGDHEVVMTDTIDVLAGGGGRRCNAFVGTSCFLFLGGGLPEPAASQFRFATVVGVDEFTMWRFRADQPVPVTKAQLVPPRDLPEALAVVTP